MAGIGTTISVSDRLSQPMRVMTNATRSLNDTMRESDRISDSLFKDMQSGAAEAQVNRTNNAISITVEGMDSVLDLLERSTSAAESMADQMSKAADEANKMPGNIDKGTSSANGLMSALKGVLSVAGAISAIKFAANWVNDMIDTADAQNKVEAQLRNVLKNIEADENHTITFDAVINESHISNFDTVTKESYVKNIDNVIKESYIKDIDTITNESLVTAATMTLDNSDYLDGIDESIRAYDSINGREAVVTVGLDDSALIQGANSTIGVFDLIKQKASELQGTTIYGDEAYLAGAAELSTYISDANALMVAMDTLSNYATGMTGGAALDTTGMTDMATQLGKVFIGKYDGILKKGFELTDQQKKIIENGTDMEKALVISDMINESWGGLAEDMASLPYGQIEQTKNAWGDVKEVIGNQLYPAVGDLFSTINSNMPHIQSMLQGTAFILSSLMNVASSVIDAIGGKFDELADKEQKVSDTMAGVAGVFAVAGAAVYNIFGGVVNGVIRLGVEAWNFIATFAHDLGEVFDNPVNAIVRLIGDMADFVYDVIGGIAGVLDWVFGSNLESGVRSWQNDMNEWLDENFGRSTPVEGLLNAEDYMLKMERIDYIDAADAGGEWGRKLAESFKIKDEASEDELRWANATADYTGETARNTASINDKLTDEIVKYMRDIAERDLINRFTTAEIKVELGGVTNNINNNTDIDGFVDELSYRLEEQLYRTAESVNFG